jgi:predicted alpha/beta hydrolase
VAHLTHFAAQGEAWGNVLLAGAMGVRQEFYEPLARWLAARGANVVTFDYTGIGRARPERLADLDVDVMEWLSDDMAPALAAARDMAPVLPLVIFGHSLGGQLLGIVPGREHVRAAVTVTAGSGYYRLNPRMPLRLRFFWFVAVPISLAIWRYYPGKRLRMVGDLPRNVMRQWRRWCTHPDYLLSEGDDVRASFAAVRTPIQAWSFTDDVMISPHAVERMHQAYASAKVEYRCVDPRAEGRRCIGHVGFFHPSCEPLWREALQWLQAHTAASAPHRQEEMQP